jgi:hypothetical protein
LRVVLTNAPTTEFLGQHDVDAPRIDERSFRQGWRIRTRLDQLLADNRITRGQWQAAVSFRDAWDLARTTKRKAPSDAIRGSGAPGAAMIAKLDAAEMLRIVEVALGEFAVALIRCCAVDDLAWAAIGRQLDRDPETVRDWTVIAIRCLGRAWAVAERQRSRRALSDDPEGPGGAVGPS